MIPLHPPAAWFDRPDWLEPGMKLTVTTDGEFDGRVAGYVAPWDACILDGKPGCWSPPSSPSNYLAAMQGDTLTADGGLVKTANIGGGVNHARLSASFQGAVAHMENTASQLMRVRYGEDEYGIWCAGALWPDITPTDLAVVRASALSGDWRFRQEHRHWDMAGAILVNTPGFPLSRAAAAVFPFAELDDVVVGGMGGPGGFDPIEDDAHTCPSCAASAQREATMQERLEDVERSLADVITQFTPELLAAD